MNDQTPTHDTALESVDIDGLKRLLPHRPPFLLIDKLTDIRPKHSAVGWKAVTVNEPHFVGHFPDYAVMPGVLIIEAMAQAAGALVVHSLGLQDSNRKVYFMTIDRARFRRPVRPGEVLRIPVSVQRNRGPVWKFEGKAYSGNDLCAEAEYSAMLTDAPLSGGVIGASTA
jgi:3-hydroxyacyl-[acyl-carrier-protein] dehydratase